LNMRCSAISDASAVNVRRIPFSPRRVEMAARREEAPDG